MIIGCGYECPEGGRGGTLLPKRLASLPFVRKFQRKRSKFLLGKINATSFVSNRTDRIRSAGIPLIDEFQHHPSFRNLIIEDLNVLVF